MAHKSALKEPLNPSDMLCIDKTHLHFSFPVLVVVAIGSITLAIFAAFCMYKGGTNVF